MCSEIYDFRHYRNDTAYRDDEEGVNVNERQQCLLHFNEASEIPIRIDETDVLVSATPAKGA